MATRIRDPDEQLPLFGGVSENARFMKEKWTVAEMEAILGDVGTRSIHYYFAKLGPDSFVGDRA